MEKEKKTTNRNLKSQNIVRLVLLLCILILANIISSNVFTRFDLTSEKRFTLSDATKSLLKKLPDVIYVKAYLAGDFPPAFKRLENSTRELLDEMRIYAGDNLQYEFIDPSENADEKQRNELYRQLYNKGLQPTNLQQKDKESSSEKVIFPGAVISFASKEAPVQLLKEQLGAASESAINSSIEGLEYEFSNAFRKIISHEPAAIAFIDGHGELEKNKVADIAVSLQGSYSVKRKKINGQLHSLDEFKAIIIAKPDSAFDEKDKFIIDQFIMKGGKVVWLIDPMVAEMDSLATNNEAIAVGRELNLDDMLFRYGVRINYDLVQDLQAAPIPMVIGYSGGKPQQSLMPWYYFPLVFPESKHPIVNNLNAIRFQFVSSMDTVGAKEIKKTVLLTSSKYTKVSAAPVRISLEQIRKEPDERDYSKPNKIIAVLLEGNFTSNFTNRVPPVIAEDKEIGFKESGVATKMVVISDGDVIRNDYRKATESVLPLGYDRYTGQTFGNKNFLLNVIDYLCDDSGLISIRSKEIKLRLLDKTLLTQSKTKWMIINTVGPLLLLFIFAIAKFYSRKRKFTS